MADEIPKTDARPDDKRSALLFMAMLLYWSDSINARVSNEIRSYCGDRPAIKLETEIKEFSRYMRARRVTERKLKILQCLSGISPLKFCVQEITLRVRASYAEAIFRFLVSHGHSVHTIAEVISSDLDVTARKIVDSISSSGGANNIELVRSITNVSALMDTALAAAREFNLPHYAAILEARGSHPSCPSRNFG